MMAEQSRLYEGVAIQPGGSPSRGGSQTAPSPRDSTFPSEVIVAQDAAMRSAPGSGSSSAQSSCAASPTTASGTSAMFPARRQPTNTSSVSSTGSSVKETRHISIDYNPVSGRKTSNTYEIIRELGRGEHGRVKLGYDVNKQIYVAIKLINRKEKPRLGRPQGSSKLEKIHREIAILKKCSHPNIVQSLEVLDDEKSRKIYLVLEYCQKGEIRWQQPDGKPALSREQARSVARDVALGLEYLHINNVIHRDIKPANSLVADDNVVKISDFGVSYSISSETSPGAELELAKTVGTPAFFSPESCIPTETCENGERKSPSISSKVDVWAFGVTSFCFSYGYSPFEADNEYESFRVIANDAVSFPDTGSDVDLAQANDSLAKSLVKDPSQRPSITQIKHHPWLSKNISKSAKEDFLHRINKDAIEVSPEEVDQAVQGVSIKSRIKQSSSKFAETIKPHGSRSRSKLGDESSSKLAGSSLGTKSSASNSNTSVASSAAKPSVSKSSSKLKSRSNSSSKNNSSVSISTKTSTSTAPQSGNPSSKAKPLTVNTVHTANPANPVPSPPAPATPTTPTSKSAPADSSGMLGVTRAQSRNSSMTTASRNSSSSSNDRIVSSNLAPNASSPRHSTNSTHAAHSAHNPPNSSASAAHSNSPGPHCSFGLMPMNIADDNSSLASHSKGAGSSAQSCSSTTADAMPTPTSPTAATHAAGSGSASASPQKFGGRALDAEPSPTHLNTRSPELEIPRLDSDSFWDDPETSSSSSEDDSGELTLVVGRNRSRSIERGGPSASTCNLSTTSTRSTPPPMPTAPGGTASVPPPPPH